MVAKHEQDNIEESPQPIRRGSRINRSPGVADPLLGVRGSQRIRNLGGSMRYNYDDDDNINVQPRHNALSHRNESMDNSVRRSSRFQDSQNNESYSNNHSASSSPLKTKNSSKSRRSKESNQEEEEDDDNEIGDDDDVDEEDDDGKSTEDNKKKYEFRNRSKTRRELLNVQNLGVIDTNATVTRKSSRIKNHASNTSSNSNNANGKNNTNHQQRLYLGGKIPNFNHPMYKKNRDSPRKNKSASYSSRSVRKHFDSSSESSGSENERRNRDGYMNNNRANLSSSLYGSNKFRRHSHGGEYSNDRDRDGHRNHHPNDSEHHQFMHYEEDRLQKERDSIQPINMNNLNNITGSGPSGGGMGGSVRDSVSTRDLARADVTPIAIDPSLGFPSVGGLDSHIQALKEMVILPLLYPEVFSRFNTQPPRGVLFLGRIYYNIVYMHL